MDSLEFMSQEESEDLSPLIRAVAVELSDIQDGKKWWRRVNMVCLAIVILNVFKGPSWVGWVAIAFQIVAVVRVAGLKREARAVISSAYQIIIEKLGVINGKRLCKFLSLTEDGKPPKEK